MACRAAGHSDKVRGMPFTQTVLEKLYRSPGEFVSRAEAPEEALAELAGLGYVIETHPHWGVRLLQSPDRLMAEDLQARLRTRVIGREVLVFEETASTNDVVAQLAQADRAEGTVVFAESQTRGRGRHGRSWVSPRGKGLWFSVLLRPTFPISRLTVAAAVAVVRTVGSSARIKWPNDVMWDGKKLAGILTEARGNVAILGVGLNVNGKSEDYPAIATSLEMATGKAQDRVGLAVRLLAEIEDYYRKARDDFNSVSREWANHCTTLGKQLIVTMGPRRLEGQAYALDENGALILRRDNGQTERILGADVTVEHG